MMIYVWSYPNTSEEKDWGLYDYEVSPDFLLLKTGCYVAMEKFAKPVKLDFVLPEKELIKRDCLLNNILVPLVNERLKRILQDVASDEVQFIPAICICSDGILEDYSFVNATQLMTGIDHEKSKYSLIAGTDAILGFKHLAYKKGCMNHHNLARDKEYRGHLLVSEKVKLAFEKEKITGVWLAQPEEYYRP